MIDISASKCCIPLHRFVQPTSIAAYHQLEASGVLAGDVYRLYNLYKRFVDGLTDREAARYLGLPCSTVSARRHDLTKAYNRFADDNGLYGGHLVLKLGVRKNDSGVSALVWGLKK